MKKAMFQSENKTKNLPIFRLRKRKNQALFGTGGTGLRGVVCVFALKW
jgi:hypothetical protein